MVRHATFEFNRSCPLQTDRIFDIADVPFSQVSDEDKIKFSSKIKESGSYRGYKLRECWARIQEIILCSCVTDTSAKTISDGIKDQIEHYNSKSLERL